MRLCSLPLVAVAVLGLVGCGGKPDLRPDPVDIKVTVTVPAGSPKDLAVSFNPMDNGHPTGGKVGADGTVTVKAIPGRYTYFFPAEANAAVAGYKQVPAKYRTASQDNTVELSSGGATIAVN